MIFGKVALISYIFSAVLLGVALMLYNALGIVLYRDINGNNTATEDYLSVLVGRHDVTVSANPNFIFGDYLAGLQAIGGILINSVTGGIVFDALTAIPFWNADFSIMIIFRLIFTFCTACLIINLLTGRDI